MAAFVTPNLLISLETEATRVARLEAHHLHRYASLIARTRVDAVLGAQAPYTSVLYLSSNVFEIFCVLLYTRPLRPS